MFAQWPRLLCVHIQRIQYLTPEVSLKRPDQVVFERELQVASVSPYVRRLFVSSSSPRGRAAATPANPASSSSRAASSALPSPSPSSPGDTQSASHANANLRPVDQSTAEPRTITTPTTTTPLANVELGALMHRYRLRSLVSHLGVDADSGHYVSLRVAPASAGDTRGERWLRASDTAVAHVSFDDVADSQAYLLFYERVA